MLIQPTPSVSVTMAVPPKNPVAVALVSSLLQRKVNGVVPPVMVAVAWPLEPPKQETSLSVTTDRVPPVFFPIRIVAVSVQLVPSVPVTV